MTARPAGRLLLSTLLAATACTVPKGAGFDEVQHLIGARTGERLHWNQGTAADEEVARAVQALLHRDLTVSAAVQIALLHNPRLQATYERLGIAQADLVQAGLLRNPTLSGALHFPYDGGVFAWDFSVMQEFLDLFLIPLRKRFARAEFTRVKLEVADAVLELSGEVRAAFYTVQASLQVAGMRRTVLEAAQAAAELAGSQHQAGNLSDLDLASEQALYAQAKLELARSEAQVLADRERLSRLLGAFGGDTAWHITAPLPAPPQQEPALAHLESFAVAHRLDLLAAREQVRTAAGALAVTRSSRFVSAVQAGGHVERELEGYRAAGPNVQLQLPLFDQGQAAVARLQAQLRQSQRLLDHLAIQVRSEVRAARDRVLAGRAMLDYYRAVLLPLRERIVALSQQQYNAMLLGVYQLLQAREAESHAYREYIEAVRDYWIARSDLERAAGGRLPDPSSAPASPARPGERTIHER